MPRDESTRRLAILALVIRVILGCIFIYTGYSKLKPLPGFSWSAASIRTSLAYFGFAVDGYQILPPWGVALLAHLLPFVELGLGALLVTGLALRFASFFSVIAIFTFFSAQLSAYLRNLVIPCGCELFSGEQIGPLSLSIDALLLLMSLGLTFAAFRARRPKHPADSKTEGSVPG